LSASSTDYREIIRSIADQVLKNCRECGSCESDCEFLKKYGLPTELAKIFRDGLGTGSQIAYSCNLCGLCEAVCPEDINIGKLCLAVREHLVSEGKAPLPGHQTVKKTQEFVLSDAFRFVHPDPVKGKCERVFFPGCNLSGYAPSLVLKSYEYLCRRLNDTGIILGCCGAPNHFLGEDAEFRQNLIEIEKDIKTLGARQIIVACPDCYRSMKENLLDMDIKSIYEVMLELGLPANIAGEQWTFSIHDSCTARNVSGLRESVRVLIREMGYEIEEVDYSGEKARCCGMGGMVPFIDFELAGNITKRRADEFHFDIVSYCAGCREVFAMEKASLHVLDLIFNPNWKAVRCQATKTGKKRREAQSQTKALLLELLQNAKQEKARGLEP